MPPCDDKEGHNKKNLNRKKHKMNLKRQTVVIAMALAATSCLVFSASADPPANPTLVGVWQVVRHGINCNTGQELRSFPILTTFNGDGTLHIDGDIHGVWQREPGRQNYSFREVYYSFDPDSGDFTGFTVGTASVHMTSPTTYTATATIQDFDPNGSLLATHCGRSEATRFQ
jgi:hypothetical protein